MITCINKISNYRMIITTVQFKDKERFNRLALHPLQSWEWGEFRKKTGIEVVRLGKYDKEKLVETAQLTIHWIPFTSWTIGYLPKGGIPSCEMLNKLVEIGRQYRCIFIKLEPNVRAENSQFKIVSSPHSLFTKYTFQLDLSKSEEELLAAMHPKTRYNIKVAQKHKVYIKEDNTSGAFEKYLQLTFETTKRQKFFAHDRRYHQLMWETLKPPGIAHLFTANYKSGDKNQILVTWIVFLFNDILYYPYGASSSEFRNVMASNLMMWEAILWGKNHGAKVFDMWGGLGPNPDPIDPWYGFHRFKQGFGPKLIEFAGSFDLVINPHLYRLYNLTYKARQILLKIKSNLQ